MASGRILVVDDEKEELEGLWRTLKLGGYSVWKARTAKEALELCDEHHFDLMVVDLVMPNMTGIELLGRVRKKLPLIRSIILSGKIVESGSESELANILRERVEADLFLKKPASNDRLSNSVAELLSTANQSNNWRQRAKRAVDVQRATIKYAKKTVQDLRPQLKKSRKKK